MAQDCNFGQVGRIDTASHDVFRSKSWSTIVNHLNCVRQYTFCMRILIGEVGGMFVSLLPVPMFGLLVDVALSNDTNSLPKSKNSHNRGKLTTKMRHVILYKFWNMG